MSVRVGELGLTLPAGYAGRAEGIARGVAAELGSLVRLGSLTLPHLSAPAVRIESGASDAEIVRAISRAILERARAEAEASW